MKDIKSKVKNHFTHHLTDEILDEIIETTEKIKKELNSLTKGAHKMNADRIKLLEGDLIQTQAQLSNIKKQRSRKTANGKILVHELQNQATRARRSMELVKVSEPSEFDINRAFSDVYNFIDKTRNTETQLDNLPYPNIGITVTGFVFAVIPFLNLLSIIFGGYLAFSNDRRAQINGFLMIGIVIIVVLFSLLI